MFFINDLGFFWCLKCIFSDKFNCECLIIININKVGDNVFKNFI